MNFLHILRRFIFIFFTILCWVYLGPNLSATEFQEFGHPHIQTCLPGVYSYINHYNSIVQNDEGFIFIGARNGILRYDDISWKYIPATGDIHLAEHQGRIITFSKNQLGTIIRTDPGDLVLAEGIQIPDDMADDDTLNTDPINGDIIQVISNEENIYMLTSEGLSVLKDGLPIVINTGTTPTRIFPFHDGILILTEDNTIFHQSGDQIREIQLPGEAGELSAVIPVDDMTMFITGRNKDYLLCGPENNFIGFEPETRISGSCDLTCAARLTTGQLAFGTSSNGVIVTEDNGTILTRINTSQGLYGNKIIQLLADASGNLWALHEHALSRIEIPSAYSYFNTENGLDGNIRDLLRHRGILYAASSRGLFRLVPQQFDTPGHLSGPAGFVRIPDITGDCRCLASTPEVLLAGSNSGLFEMKGGQVSKMLSDPVNALYYEPGHNILFAGTEKGLRIFHLNDWSEITNFSLPNVSIDDIAYTASGVLWLSSSSGVLYKSTKPFSDAGNLGYESYTSEDRNPLSGSYINLINLSEKLYFSGDKGLYTYHPAEQTFIPDTLLSLPYRRDLYRINQMQEDAEDMLWICINHPSNTTHKIWMVGKSETGNYQMQPLSYRRLNNKIINCLYPDQGNILWIGTHQGLLRYDPSFTCPEKPMSRTYIAGLSVGMGPPVDYDELASQTFQQSLRNGRLMIPRANNRINIRYNSTDFNCESEHLYQFRLTGYHDQWSEWVDESFVEFSNLDRGDYEFQVRHQDIFGSVSQPGSFRFKIKAPVYASWYAFLFYSLLVLFLLYLLQKWRQLHRLKEQYHLEEVVLERTESLVKEKDKAEDLLANILPKTTAEELKSKGKASSSKFKMVTVLFADIQGFTKIAEQMNPDKLIDQLDRFYFHFDSVVEKYNIEKIKTIGDAYMAAGGIPIKNRTNPVEVVLAALEMQQHMKDLRESHSDIWDLRVGLHTGSVIAGVVGQKKYSYDIWGDTVNTASRMESSGEVGRVNISATTYKLIKDFFQCEFRGKMPVKYKGDIAMFFVNGLNPTYSEADKITPNAKFWVQVQLLRLLDLEEFIIDKLEKELPENLLFHNVEHTAHVYAQVELLGRGEKVGEEDLLLLRTAALLHDMGYIDRMDDHETRSVEFAREILPLYRYTEEQIDRICELIMATSMPPKPGNLLEEIICDANLDHLGRVDFLIQSDKLFQEYRIHKRVKSKKDWNQHQVDFLETHDFYTGIANRMREVSKEQQIENIKQFS